MAIQIELNLPKNSNKTWLLHFDYNKAMAHFRKGDITLSQATCHIEFNSEENNEGLDYTPHNFTHCLRSCNFHNSQFYKSFFFRRTFHQQQSINNHTIHRTHCTSTHHSLIFILVKKSICHYPD